MQVPDHDAVSWPLHSSRQCATALQKNPLFRGTSGTSLSQLLTLVKCVLQRLSNEDRIRCLADSRAPPCSVALARPHDAELW